MLVNKFCYGFDNKIMLNLDGKTAIVTGCGSEGEGWGNGRAIATLLARQGAKVIGTDLNYKAAKNTQDFILEENNKCEIHEVNMSNKKDVDSFFKNVTKQHEKINILVNNVGRSEPGDPEVMDYDVWREQFSTNLDTAFFAIKQIIPTMKKIGGGSIARVNKLEQIITGPDSAGSYPGPACYDNGGDKPTITDADLVIGKINPKNFA